MKQHFTILITLMLSAFNANAVLISNTEINASTSLTAASGFTIDQIADGIIADAPFNGFVSRVQSGTINLSFNSGPHNLTSFELYNDVNIRAEGIQDFRLDFFNTAGDFISSFSDTAPFNQFAAGTYTFDLVANVSQVDLVVLNSYSAFGIEIREVTFNGTAVVPAPTAIWLIALGLGLMSLNNRKHT